eukprot:1136537-Pelagomonas_calceolata.AAC.3
MGVVRVLHPRNRSAQDPAGYKSRKALTQALPCAVAQWLPCSSSCSTFYVTEAGAGQPNIQVRAPPMLQLRVHL